MKIIKLTPNNSEKVIKQAIQALQQDKLIIYPTETCYGLGADATNQQAVDRLLKFKTRHEGKAFSVAVADQLMASEYVNLNETAQNLYKNFLPGPLTIVSQIKSKFSSKLARGIASEFNTLGIRISDYSFVLHLVKQFNKPITATSANVAYQSPPYSYQQWQKQTPKKSQLLIELWIDAGKLPKRPPSTVIDTTVDELTVIRQGRIKISSSAKESITKSEQTTHQLAQNLIKQYQYIINTQGLIIGLQGELGAGKTQFCKGLAKELAIRQSITSPTFTLVNEYPILSKNYQLKTNNYFYHIDTWRMEKPQELLDLGFENMLKPGNIIAIEWIEKVSNLVQNLSTKHHSKLLFINIDVVDQKTRKWRIIKAQKTR